MPDWKQRLAQAFKGEGKKLIILAVLFVVAVVLVARMVLKPKGPARAHAAPRVESFQPESPAEAHLSQADEAVGKPDRHVQRLDRTIRRDIFLPDPDFFPSLPEKQVRQRELPLAAAPAEAALQARREFIRAQAAELALQSTVVGAVPTAIINGRVLLVGGWIDGFQVVEITPHKCMVRKNDIKITLEMSEE